MARKEPNRIRNKTIQIRLTADEISELKSAAASVDQSVADFVIAAARKEEKRVLVATELPQVLFELRKQGNNLNQLTKLANSIHSIDVEVFKKAIEDCQKVRTELVELIKKYGIKLKK